MGIYNIVASKVSDTTLDAMIESGQLRDLTAEFALAKLAVAELHASAGHASDRLDALSTFFNIAKTLQTIESGGLLNNAWNDPLVSAMRSKFRTLIGVMVDIIQKYVPDKQLRALMLQELKERSKMIGNSVTITPSGPDADKADDILDLQETTTRKTVIDVKSTEPGTG
jgi:hypothetical protein